MKRKLIFTGGHHTSALVVAKELKKQGIEIIWFGHRHSMWADKSDSGEYKEVTQEGIKFYDLQAGKFYHTWHPLKLLRIPWGFLQAFVWLIVEEPDGIVSFGGYLAVPTVISGWLLGVPSITHEQVIVAGWANRLISLFAKKIALSWPSSSKYYPRSKTVLTGLPIRPEIIDISTLNRRKHVKPHLFITGGKQGSHIINQAIFDSLPQLLEKYIVIHQTGSSSTTNDYAVAQAINLPNYSYFDFDSKLQIESFKQADVIIGRSGIHTVYELGFLGIPSVLIPLEKSSHDEQLLNAQLLANNNLAVIILEKELSTETLLSSIEQALALPAKPLELPINATEKIVSLIISQLVK
jgi:UDP-N-acetylglucosamine--N-acetylmuramyl-(pentapeptide) pyrophosphoryl-undecaprenol N-acetylglucosamine transferase